MSERKLKAWQDAGLIDAATVARIRAWEAEHSRPLALWAVIGIGALAIGLGIVSVVAANWDEIPGLVRLAVHFAVMAGLAGWLWWREPALSANHPGAHEAAVFVLGALGLGFMGHLGQVYQTSSPLWQPVGLWLLLFAPLLFGRGLSWLTAAMAFGATIFTAWGYAADSDRAGAHEAEMAYVVRTALVMCAPVLLAGIAAQARRFTSRPHFWHRTEQLGLGYAVLGATFAAISAAVDRLPSSPEAGRILVASLIAGGLGLASAALIRRARPGPAGTADAAIMAGAAAMPLAAFLLSGNQTVAALLFMALLAGIAAAALYAGWRGVFQLAVAIIALRLIVLSFELAGDLLTSGAGLIASGVLILAIAWSAVRVSKRFAPPAVEDGP